MGARIRRTISGFYAARTTAFAANLPIAKNPSITGSPSIVNPVNLLTEITDP
jgi:hypothetical protein